MPLTSRLTAQVNCTHVGTAGALDLGTITPISALVAQTKDLQLADGTGAAQADRLFSDTRTLAASANEDLDLAGALADAIGGTAVFARIKGLYIAAASGNTNNVIVGAAASNAWATLLGATHTITLRPGAWIMLGTGATDATGYTVTAGTGDLLRIANSAGSTTVTYDIAVIGCSA